MAEQYGIYTCPQCGAEADFAPHNYGGQAIVSHTCGCGNKFFGEVEGQWDLTTDERGR